MSRQVSEPAPERLRAVLAQIASACRAAARNPDEVTLVVVSKTRSIDEIEELLQAGHRHFGENRVQEAQSKWPELKKKYPDCVLHLIGPLQTNKAREAVGLFDVIETVDRPKLARILAAEMKEQARTPLLYAQVNTGAEPQKTGVLPDDLPQFLQQISADYGLVVDGLMCIPPQEEEPALHFALLEKLARMQGLKVISCGMSADFEVAIAQGATQVRVGTAIFGPRTPI
ncbi:MAG: YggS family pyridoxal phosphate-dependent enzyme [Alphaproteobacteria bacterium]